MTITVITSLEAFLFLSRKYLLFYFISFFLIIAAFILPTFFNRFNCKSKGRERFDLKMSQVNPSDFVTLKKSPTRQNGNEKKKCEQFCLPPLFFFTKKKNGL